MLTLPQTQKTNKVQDFVRTGATRYLVSQNKQTLRDFAGDMKAPFALFLAYKASQGIKKSSLDSYKSLFKMLSSDPKLTNVGCSVQADVKAALERQLTERATNQSKGISKSTVDLYNRLIGSYFSTNYNAPLRGKSSFAEVP